MGPEQDDVGAASRTAELEAFATWNAHDEGQGRAGPVSHRRTHRAGSVALSCGQTSHSEGGGGSSRVRGRSPSGRCRGTSWRRVCRRRTAVSWVGRHHLYEAVHAPQCRCGKSWAAAPFPSYRAPTTNSRRELANLSFARRAEASLHKMTQMTRPLCTANHGLGVNAF